MSEWMLNHFSDRQGPWCIGHRTFGVIKILSRVHRLIHKMCRPINPCNVSIPVNWPCSVDKYRVIYCDLASNSSDLALMLHAGRCLKNRKRCAGITLTLTRASLPSTCITIAQQPHVVHFHSLSATVSQNGAPVVIPSDHWAVITFLAPRSARRTLSTKTSF